MLSLTKRNLIQRLTRRYRARFCCLSRQISASPRRPVSVSPRPPSHVKGDAQLLFHVPFHLLSSEKLPRSFSDSSSESSGIATSLSTFDL
jgi:hypothetical protein